MITCMHRRRVQHTVEYFGVLGIHRDRRSDDCKSSLEQPPEQCWGTFGLYVYFVIRYGRTPTLARSVHIHVYHHGRKYSIKGRQYFYRSRVVDLCDNTHNYRSVETAPFWVTRDSRIRIFHTDI